MQGLRNVLDCPVLEDDVDNVRLEAIALVFREGEPFLLHTIMRTLMAYSKMTRVNTLVSLT